MNKFDFGSVERPFAATWPVLVQVPQDGGKIEEQEFSVKFRLVPEDEVKEADADRTDPVKALLRKAVVEIEGAPDSAELLERLMSRGYVKLALSKAYAQFGMGIAAKN